MWGGPQLPPGLPHGCCFWQLILVGKGFGGAQEARGSEPALPTLASLILSASIIRAQGKVNTESKIGDPSSQSLGSGRCIAD